MTPCFCSSSLFWKQGYSRFCVPPLWGQMLSTSVGGAYRDESTIPYTALPPFLSYLLCVRKLAFAPSRVWGHNWRAGLCKEMFPILGPLKEFAQATECGWWVSKQQTNHKQVLLFLCCLELLRQANWRGERGSYGLWCCHQNLVFL